MTNEVKPTIKHRYTGAVLFEGEAGMTTRKMLEKATAAKVNLSYSDLSYSNLSGSDLSGSDLRDSDLRDSDLSGSDLSGSDLSDSNLSYSDLRGSNLSDSNLRYAKNADLAIAKTRILPEGQLIGWKKCMNGVIVKLQIPAKAKRSHAFGRKCRAEYAKVLQIFGADVAISQHDQKTQYVKGETVYPDSFSDNWQEECAPGIHFFITRSEAENY